jgi:hypothetical protein
MNFCHRKFAWWSPAYFRCGCDSVHIFNINSQAFMYSAIYLISLSLLTLSLLSSCRSVATTTISNDINLYETGNSNGKNNLSLGMMNSYNQAFSASVPNIFSPVFSINDFGLGVLGTDVRYGLLDRFDVGLRCQISLTHVEGIDFDGDIGGKIWAKYQFYNDSVFSSSIIVGTGYFKGSGSRVVNDPNTTTFHLFYTFFNPAFRTAQITSISSSMTTSYVALPVSIALPREVCLTLTLGLHYSEFYYQGEIQPSVDLMNPIVITPFKEQQRIIMPTISIGLKGIQQTFFTFQENDAFKAFAHPSITIGYWQNQPIFSFGIQYGIEK